MNRARLHTVVPPSHLPNITFFGWDRYLPVRQHLGMPLTPFLIEHTSFCLQTYGGGVPNSSFVLAGGTNGSVSPRW